MFRLINLFFYSPDDSPAPTIDLVDDDTPETIDLDKPKETKPDDTKVDETEETDETKTETEDEDELKELIEEIEEPDEEKLELVTPVRRREILKKYPEIFKDFPYLEKAYYREQQYTEIFPTINDAKEAVERSEILGKFETDLMGGNLGTVLEEVAKQNKNSFYKIVDELMPTIAKIDNSAYTHILGNMMNYAVVGMSNEAKRTKNEALQNAAHVLYQYVFGTADYKAPTRLAQDIKPDEKTNELQTREREFSERQFNQVSGDLNTRLSNTLRATIENNIDPKESMTDYVKRNAVREANEQLESLIGRDTRFRSILDRLWEAAFKDNFSRESLSRIETAYKSKAKTLLPAVIKKARIDALKGMGKRVSEKVDDDKEEPKNTRGRSQPDKSDKTDVKKSVPRDMSTLDFLNS